MEMLLVALMFIVLISLGLIGMWVERRHFESLARREQAYAGIAVSDMRSLPPNWTAENPQLVTGQVVIATDYLKEFFSSWRKIFGGRMRSYEKMLERARREATLRMIENAVQKGANIVWNVRYETSMIQNSNGKSAAGTEVLAYGTAMRVRET